MEKDKLLLLKEQLMKNKEVINSIASVVEVEFKRVSLAFEDMTKILEDLLSDKKCLYCQTNTTDSIDSNVLCPSCREDTGHSFFNEL